MRRGMFVGVAAAIAVLAGVIAWRGRGGTARPGDICAGAAATVEEALALGNHAAALTRIEDGVRAKPACEEALRGARSEALAGLGRADEANQEADRALVVGRDPHALFGKARALFLQGNEELARRYAEMAVQANRGADARVLYGLILYRANDLDAAEREFRAALATRPNDVPATYDLALVAHRKNRYLDAREGYLRALQLEPKHADARYNLGLLTQNAGAKDEAKHHLEELVRLAGPEDARVVNLKKALDGG